MLRRAPVPLLLLMLFAALAGCSGDGLDRAAVGGAITINGKPLEQGSIVLIPSAGTAGPSAGGTIEAGQYFIPAEKGPVPGNYRVEIKAMRKTGRQIVDEHQPPPHNLIDEMEQFIPERYNVQSELAVEVTSGRNRNVDFALKSED